MGSEATQKRTRSIRSYSLRLLLLLTTVCCLGLAVWRVAIRPYQLQFEAAKAIEEVGGQVRMVPSSTWMARVFGQKQFNDIVEVNLMEHDDASEYSKHLAYLPRLQSLVVGSNFTDHDMRYLANCKGIRRLSFKQTQITDEGLRVCENFAYLRLLELGRNITDDGLAVLQDKRHLAYLDLSCTQVTDSGLEHLRDLPSLHKVRLNFRPIKDSGLSIMRSLPKLDELYLVGCVEITNEGLASLATLDRLKQLDVSDTRIEASTYELLEEALTECRILLRDSYY